MNFVHPSLQNPNSYSGAFQERISLFTGYYRSLFLSDSVLLLSTIIIAIAIFKIIKSKNSLVDETLSFFYSIFTFLLLLSVLNKDSFFWSNYYEGIQYLFLFIIAIILNVGLRTKPVALTIGKVSLVILIFALCLNIFYKEMNKRPSTQGGLNVISNAVKYIQSFQKEKNEDYCVKIYTPPVIPYTYQYIFLYNQISKKIHLPKNDWVKKRCWFVIEPDSFSQRRDKWILENLPKNAKAIQKYTANDTEIILYER